MNCISKIVFLCIFVIMVSSLDLDLLITVNFLNSSD